MKIRTLKLTTFLLTLTFVATASAAPKFNFTASHPRIPPTVIDVFEAPNLSVPANSPVAQPGTACGTGVTHCVVLSWTASTSAAACLTTGTPPCTFGYNVFRGTATGAEGSIPLNASLVTGATFTDPITLTSSPQTFFYTVVGVETVNGVTVISTPSNEASASFPGIPTSPSGTTATPH